MLRIKKKQTKTITKIERLFSGEKTQLKAYKQCCCNNEPYLFRKRTTKLLHIYNFKLNKLNKQRICFWE